MLANSLILVFAFLAAAVPMPQAAEAITTSNYWLAEIKRQGQATFNSDTNYKVFRNVVDYGAKGDGNTDDTQAIQNAIQDGNRCGQGCDSSTITPAIVYFPPGAYRISSPILVHYYSQLIGDALRPPTLLAASTLQGIAMLDADPYIPGGWGAQWYTNQNNFFRQIRNFVIDMRQLPEIQATAGIHWQVAQATSLQNIVFHMAPKSKANGQVGIFMENGSGGFMSDLTFNGGNISMNIGSQQFTTRNIQIDGSNTAVKLIWNWLWTFKSLNISNCNVGIDMAAVNNANNQTVGSSVLMDSTFRATPIGVLSAFDPQSHPKAGGTLVVQNVDFTGANNAITHPDGHVILKGGAKVALWAQGDAYLPVVAPKAKRTLQMSVSPSCEPATVTVTTTVTMFPSATPTGYNSTTSPIGTGCTATAVPVSMNRIQQGLTALKMPTVLLDSTGAVFQRARPQYEDVSVSSFISAKSAGAKGDGQTDDSDALQRLFDSTTSGQVVYFDHGAYVITRTIQIPKNIRITGEVWPLIMIKGAFFQDMNNPRPAFRVGRPGDVGNVEISDLIFETLGPAPGAVMMEWNVASSSQGSCAMWDVHFRVGGSAGTELTDGNCKAGTSQVFKAECAGSFLMMHITQEANAYLENTWFWLADHDIDTATHNQTTIFNGRGLLVESKGPTWLYGTASEHNVLYNYQFANAQNVFMGAIQTESAYFQAAPDALSGGFIPSPAYGDPMLSDCTGPACKKTWGLRIVKSSDIYMFGGGLYSFFDNYDQDCLDTESCQENMIDIQCSSNIHLHGLVTKASTNMVNVNGKPAALQVDNDNLFGATVALFQQM